MVGRVMNRLRRKPCYMPLRELAEIWNFSIHYISTICDIARAPL